jgi:hypothetical protein
MTKPLIDALNLPQLERTEDLDQLVAALTTAPPSEEPDQAAELAEALRAQNEAVIVSDHDKGMDLVFGEALAGYRKIIELVDSAPPDKAGSLAAAASSLLKVAKDARNEKASVRLQLEELRNRVRKTDLYAKKIAHETGEKHPIEAEAEETSADIVKRLPLQRELIIPDDE